MYNLEHDSSHPGHQDHIHFRPLQPRDYEELKALHQELFPIDYDESFFHKAATSADRLFSVAAIAVLPDGRSKLIGCITARSMFAYECDPVDRHYLGLSSPAVASAPLVYILTLGVTQAWQKKGIARALLQHVHNHAQAMRWYLLYLHVITYNEAAIQLYSSQSYQRVACLQNFYTIMTGRTPDPTRAHYDAYIYACQLQPGQLGMAHSLLGWPGQVAWNMAMAPIRNVLGHFNACMPWVNTRHAWRQMPQPGQTGAQATFVSGPSSEAAPAHVQVPMGVVGQQGQAWQAQGQQGSCQHSQDLNGIHQQHWQQSAPAPCMQTPFVSHASLPRRRTGAGTEDAAWMHGGPSPPRAQPSHAAPSPSLQAPEGDDKHRPRQSPTLLQWLTLPSYGRS